ncbi:hypothetical protein [Streptomyces sp. NPDC092307]|uniref:hypothetical protein n=1 Tax=Streptomyces sp. NPDC092307 TaxID=3366013 RepID=UPI00382C6A6A
MTTANSVTRVQDDYAQQIAGDLAANRSAQEERRAELERLQQELGELGEGEKVLLRMQDALGIAAQSSAAPTGGRGTKPAAVPSARTAVKATKKKPQPAPAAAAAPVKAPRPRKATAASSGTGTTSAEVKEAAGGPSWLELVTAVLAGRTEPRSAAEVTEAIGAAHPTRKVQAAVIRNTLEQGVARGLLERSKQGRSVYYSPTVPTPAAPATERPQPQPQP